MPQRPLQTRDLLPYIRTQCGLTPYQPLAVWLQGGQRHRAPLAAAVLQPRPLKLQRAKQGAKRPAGAGLELERRPALWTGRARVAKGVHLRLEAVALEGAEEGCGLRQGHRSEERRVGKECR